jgi:hypothetical protein
MLLPVVLESAGTLLNALIMQHKEMDIPNARSKKQQASSTQSTKPCVLTAIPGKTKANCSSKAKDKRQIASLPAPTCP